MYPHTNNYLLEEMNAIQYQVEQGLNEMMLYLEWAAVLAVAFALIGVAILFASLVLSQVRSGEKPSWEVLPSQLASAE